MRISRARLAGILLFLAILAADAITKYWAVVALAGSPPLVITPFLQLVYVENTGISFGFFQSGSDAVRWVLVGIGVGVSVAVWVVLRQAKTMRERVGWVCVLAGAVGNIVNRVVSGYVVDFIDFHWQQWHYPAFNIADSAITLGVFIVIISLLLR